MMCVRQQKIVIYTVNKIQLFAKIVLLESSKCNFPLNKFSTEMLELSTKEKPFSLHILHNDAFTD